MKTLICLSLLLSPPVVAENLVLAPGSSVRVHTRCPGSVHLANGRLVKVREAGRDLIVIGRNVGETQLTCDSQSWSISVIKPNSFATYQTLQKTLLGMMGLELSVISGEVVVRGELLRIQDWQELHESLNENAHYKFAATMNESLRQEVRKQVSELLLKAHLPLPSLQFSPSMLVQLPAQDEKKSLIEYEQILNPYGIVVGISHNLVALEPMIRVKIVVAEVKKNFERKLGITWPQQAQASLVPPQTLPQFEKLIWTANAIEKNGNGKVLASPTLLCRSGKTAEFLAGGEFPIRTHSLHSADVVWKKHGVLLKIAPLVDLAGNMSVGIETEVSLPDRANGVENVPALVSNYIRSHFDLRKSQTIALSGLIKNQLDDGREGLPWLSRIPILGDLFSSHDFVTNKTELIVFVTPEVVTDDNAGAGTMPAGFDDER